MALRIFHSQDHKVIDQGSDMSEALQQLIQRAEEQKLEMEMQVMFTKNLNLFKQRFPNIHRCFEHHKPAKMILKLDQNRQINLIDVENKLWLYNDIPSKICEKQVASFARDARVRKFHVVKSRVQNARHIHIQGLNALLNAYEQREVKRIKQTPGLITNLIVTGVGLGYQIPNLVNQFDIKNILIHENCKDTFFASLFTLNWQPVLDYFAEQSRSITFCVGVTPERALEQIESTIHNIGLHSQIFTFVMKHSSRASESAFLDLYMNEIRAFIGGLGYFDDERIGLAHAHHNIHSRHSVFISRKKHTRRTRLIIVGNGPSLDMHEDYLRENQDKCIIFSCGTALTSLLRMGIKPDFHVEMERPSFVEDAINMGSTQAQRQGITLLCLHTVSPKTIACFDETCYAVKPNDAGALLVHEYFKPEKIPELAFSNPTVTNCALAFAVSMGFEDVHLVGVDLGMKEDAKHHSEKSIYYDMARYANKENIGAKLGEHDKYRDGNFGGKVRTPAVLDMSRSSMERLLQIITRHFPNFRCINSNDGVKINYTQSLRIEDIPVSAHIDKVAELKNIKKEHFLQKSTSDFDESTRFIEHFNKLKSALKLDENIVSEHDLFLSANKIYQSIKKDADPLTHYLMRGTVNCYLGAIFENTLYCASQDDFKERADQGIRAYNEVIDNIFALMLDSPFEIDDTVNKRMRRMREEQETKKSPD